MTTHPITGLSIRREYHPSSIENNSSQRECTSKKEAKYISRRDKSFLEDVGDIFFGIASLALGKTDYFA